MKPSIAVIGACSPIGSILSRQFHGKGFRLLLMDEDRNSLKILSRKLDRQKQGESPELYECRHEASWDSDVIWLSITEEMVPEVVERMRDVSTRKVVIAASDEESASALYEAVRKGLPYSRVVSACISREGDSRRIHLWGEDPGAMKTVEQLSRKAGFDTKVAASSGHGS